MALTTLTGTVSGIRHSTEMRGTMNRDSGSVKTAQVISFRVGDRSAQIKLPDVPDIRDGDQVTLAGEDKNGIFKAYALRNDQTRAIYSVPTTAGTIMGWLMIAVGVLLLVFIIGAVFIGIGVWTLREVRNHAQAAAMLRT
jgi:hypothetical protein